MKKNLRFLRKYAGISLASLSLMISQVASTQFCFIFHQEEIPDKVKALKKR